VGANAAGSRGVTARGIAAENGGSDQRRSSQKAPGAQLRQLRVPPNWSYSKRTMMKWSRRGSVAWRRLAAVLTITFGGVSALMGQTSLGASAIGGTVRDINGAGIPGADLELLDVQRGISRKGATNEAGDYVFNAVTAGLYTVTAAKPGFERSTVANLNVVVNQRATVDITMQVGSLTESVQVNAGGETPLLETASNALGTVIDQRRVENLPLNGRDFLQLGYLAGGVAVPQGSGDAVTGQQQHPDRSIIIAGNTQFQTSYLIDGIATRGSRLGESSLNLSVSSIDQFKIQVGFFMPDQGPNPGIVDVITKGGTNQFHGEAFEFLRNTQLDARNFFAPGPEQLQRNQFGFAIGGPVEIPRLFHGKDRLWFHANYEGTRQIQRFSSRGYTPTAAMFSGDLSVVPQLIYDPYTYDAATGKRQPFVGNVIPAGRINPISRSLLQYYLPGASYSLRPANLFANPTNTLDDDQFTIRIDGRISDRQSVFASVTYENSPVVQSGLMPLSGASYPFDSQVAMIQHTATFSPRLVNIARLGFSRSAVLNQGQAEAGPDLQTALGLTGTLDQHGIPGIAIQGFASFGRSSGPLGDKDNNYQVDEALNYARGNHNFAFGAGMRYHRNVQRNSNANAVGSLSFQTVFTAQLAPGANGLAPVANTGNSFADFLLGIPTSGQVIGLPPIHYRYTEYFPYFQDSWRATRNLTINYGLSWYYSTPPDPQGADAKIAHAFDFETGLLQYAALGQIDPKVVRPDKDNFTPRLGFAWKPEFLKNTVIRAGAGIYFGQSGLIEAQFASVGPPFQNSVSITNSQFSPLPTYVLGQNIFPVIPAVQLTPDYPANVPAGAAPFITSTGNRMPYVSQWNLSVQHTIGRNDLVEADYIGTSGHKQQNRYDADECVATASLFCSAATRPYPRYASLLYSVNNANLSYEAVVIKYQHQFSRGLTLLSNYTFSRTLSDGWESAASTLNQSANCRACDKGPVSYDVPRRLVISTVYELPVGRNRAFAAHLPWVADLFLGGWNANAIVTFSSGNAFTVVSPNRTGSVFSQVRANRFCDGRDDSLSGNLRSNGGLQFSTACFATPAAGYFGNSGRGVLFGPGVNNWDTAITKNFAIRERSRLEFRAEFFNTWNHAQFNNPDANTGDGNFGLVSSARSPRLIQGALKFVW
jgi:hypothetical protein